MKPENTKHRLTDKDRDQVLKLIVCGLSTDEIAEIMHISTSTVSYIRQAHTACMNKDWSTLQRLSTTTRPTVDWAMKVTGTDKVFLEEFPKVEFPELEAPVPTPEPAPCVHPGNLYEMYEVLTDIRSLLTEIRDMLK
jgi:transcriptional regulator with XRE-family HTH domain